METVFDAELVLSKHYCPQGHLLRLAMGTSVEDWFDFQALAQSQQIHKRVSAIGVRQEETLLEESASREAELLGSISDLEAELRTTRQSLDQFRAEAERANALATELANQVLLGISIKVHYPRSD